MVLFAGQVITGGVLSPPVLEYVRPVSSLPHASVTLNVYVTVQLQSVPVTFVFVNVAVTVPPQLSVYPVFAEFALNGAAVAAFALHAFVPVEPAYGVPVSAGAVLSPPLFEYVCPVRVLPHSSSTVNV